MCAGQALDAVFQKGTEKIRAHPLVQCAMACEEATDVILCNIPALLQRAAASGSFQFNPLLSSLLPFFSYVLLTYGHGLGVVTLAHVMLLTECSATPSCWSDLVSDFQKAGGPLQVWHCRAAF